MEYWVLEKEEKSKQPRSNVLVMTSGRNSSVSKNEDKIREVQNTYISFISVSLLSLHEHDANPKSIKILRNTGASTSLLAEGVLPLSDESATGENVLIHGVELGFISVPIHRVFLKSDLVSGFINVGVRPTLPVEGVSLLLGNNLAGKKVMVNCLSSLSCNSDHAKEIRQDIPGLYLVCAVTRAMAVREKSQARHLSDGQSTSSVGDDNQQEESNALEDLSIPTIDSDPLDNSQIEEQSSDDGSKVSTNSLIKAQESDPELAPLMHGALCEYEAAKVPTCFYIKAGILMRKWRPSTASPEDEWQVSHQIVVPKCYRGEVLCIAHEKSPLAGHLGINKTCHRVLSHFYWPGLRKDVIKLCKSCHVCQMVGKPNQKPPAPLKPIPVVGEPFSRVLIDCVGPLPKTKLGNQYFLTIMCVSTRFPEAVPLRLILF